MDEEEVSSLVDICQDAFVVVVGVGTLQRNPRATELASLWFSVALPKTLLLLEVKLAGLTNPSAPRCSISISASSTIWHSSPNFPIPIRFRLVKMSLCFKTLAQEVWSWEGAIVDGVKLWSEVLWCHRWEILDWFWFGFYFRRRHPVWSHPWRRLRLYLWDNRRLLNVHILCTLGFQAVIFYPACSIEENTKHSGHALYTTKGIKVGNMAGWAERSHFYSGMSQLYILGSVPPYTEQLMQTRLSLGLVSPPWGSSSKNAFLPHPVCICCTTTDESTSRLTWLSSGPVLACLAHSSY